MAARHPRILYTCHGTAELTVDNLLTLGLESHDDAYTLLIILNSIHFTKVCHLRGMNDSLLESFDAAARDWYKKTRTRSEELIDKTLMFKSLLNLYVTYYKIEITCRLSSPS